MTHDLHDIEVARIDGTAITLAEYSGQVLLIVNVASQCGLTPQYEGLMQLHRRYAERGLVVLGVPANDFNGQEPGTDSEILEFCQTSYDVEFPLLAKTRVTGPNKHPLYEFLIRAQPVADFDDESKLLDRLPQRDDETNAVHWNFEKFLVGRDGVALARFAPDRKPTDTRITTAIEKALKTELPLPVGGPIARHRLL